METPGAVGIAYQGAGPVGQEVVKSRHPNSRLHPACMACRQMKMKCEYSKSPPCVRCTKAGRECIPQLWIRSSLVHLVPSPPEISRQRQTYYTEQVQYSNIPTPPSANSTFSGPPSASFRRESLHSAESHGPFAPEKNDYRKLDWKSPNSDLPSIYSTFPIEAVNLSSAEDFATSESVLRRTKRRKSHTVGMSQVGVVDSNEDASFQRLDPIPKQELRDMIYKFKEENLSYFPAFRVQDFEDLDRLLENEMSLVYCICYATARHLPDGHSLRQRLLPEVIKVVQGQYRDRDSQISDISMMKSLLILCVYASMTYPTAGYNLLKGGELLFWPLKSCTEMHAQHISLYKSVQELRLEIERSGTKGVVDTLSYQRYMLCLQLFVISHYSSLTTGTPPTIRIDSTIRVAPSLLEGIGTQPQIRLLGEVELCLIWEKASFHEPQIAEWWCTPNNQEVDEVTTESLLSEVDEALDAFYLKYNKYMQGSDVDARILDYHGRFTRFYMTSYAIRSLKKTPKGLSPLQKSQIKRCVANANQVLEWPLKLSPIQKDKLRSVTDAPHTTVSFVCLFIISATQSFPFLIEEIPEALDNVTEIARLMKEIAIDAEHKPYAYGSLLLKRVKALWSSLGTEKNRTSQEITMETHTRSLLPEMNQNGVQQEINELGLPEMEMFWDFLNDFSVFPGGESAMPAAQGVS